MKGKFHEVLNFNRSFLMPLSHQCFRSVLAVKFLRIMLTNRHWPITFHTIAIGDADG